MELNVEAASGSTDGNNDRKKQAPSISKMLDTVRASDWAGLVALGIWVYLPAFRGRFWMARPAKLPGDISGPASRIAVIVPARNEAAVVGRAVASLVRQDYPGEFRIYVVDDQSEDGTADAARQCGSPGRLEVVNGTPPPRGWVGKVWAMEQGVRAAAGFGAAYILFTDADIVHGEGDLRKLVAHAAQTRCDLASLMVRLRCETAAERMLIPAFVYFFFKLYPPRWVASAHRRTAGAAGGCMLVNRASLERAGGLETIRGELIDDCALARRIKQTGGSLWMGLAETARSIREYGGFGEAGNMIARSAYTQLRYSAALLAATLAGMIVTYLLPPVLAAASTPPAALLGACAWLLMAATYAPMLRYYDRSLLWAPLLPLTACFYMWATVLSAARWWRGEGAAWKGRSGVR